MLIHIVHQLPLLASVVSALDDTEVVRSAHCLRQETLAEKWEELRNKLFNTGTSTSSMPLAAVCYVCQEDDATIRCHDCAPDTFYCESCGMSMHGDVNFYQYPERWTVSCICMNINRLVPSLFLIYIALCRVKFLSQFTLLRSSEGDSLMHRALPHTEN